VLPDGGRRIGGWRVVCASPPDSSQARESIAGVHTGSAVSRAPHRTVERMPTPEALRVELKALGGVGRPPALNYAHEITSYPANSCLARPSWF
jgi:hypothetical protein